MKNLLLYALLLCVLNACDMKIPNPFAAKPATPETTTVEPAPTTPPPAPVAATPAANTNGVPDVGKIEHVAVTAKGVGMTPGAAVNEALKNAIMQVNGVSVDASSANLNVIAHAAATVDVYSDQGHDSAKATATLQGQAYADQIITQSNGVVSSFKVTHIVAPTGKEGGSYTVDIEAQVAKFMAPADSGKIKIVVAPLRSKQRTFDIGGRAVPAAEVLAPLHRQIVDALAQTGRFTVLDRQYSNEIEDELDMIASGQTVKADMAKLGQALSADLVWVGEVNTLAYSRHVRQLQASNRDLVSYAGGWSVSQRMINLATRQIQQSTTLQGSAPSVAPTTMSRGIDGNQTLANMQADIVKKATEAILLRTFPISIVERAGNQVVLSQGGSVLKEKSRYRVYLLGKEVKDPQTGQSLGRMESPCCEVVIDRVTPSLSYATLENIQTPLDNISVGDLQLREALAASIARAADEVAAATGNSAPKGKTSGRTVRSSESGTPAPAPKPKDDW
jgi:hypothetical protein